MEKKIGFIGLGEMGKWMALNLLKAGYEVIISDIIPEAVQFFTDQGADTANTPSEMAGQVDWLFLSLPNTEIVEEVVLGSDGVIQGGKSGLVVIDLSTISYLPTLEIGNKLKDKGITFADAPVSGMGERAKEGNLTIMFGGEAAVFEELKPALDVIGNKIIHMGDVGSGQLTKLINQLLFNISCAGIAEVLPMAAKLGLDPVKVTQVDTTGTGRSFAAELFMSLALDNRFDASYPIKHLCKGHIIKDELAAREQNPMPVAQSTTNSHQK